MHPPGAADDGGNAVAAGRADEHQQRAGNQRRHGHGQIHLENGPQGRGAGGPAGLLQGGVHLLHGPGDGDKGVGIIEGAQHPDEPRQAVNIQGPRPVPQGKELPQPLVHGAHVGVGQPQPGHGPHVGRHHIGHDEQRPEELLSVQIRPPHQKGQGKGQQRPQDHGGEGGGAGIENRGLVQARFILKQALQRVQGEPPSGEQGPQHQVSQGQHHEDQQKIHDQQDQDPFKIKGPASLRPHQQAQGQHVQHQQNPDQQHGPGVHQHEMPKPADLLPGDHAQRLAPHLRSVRQGPLQAVQLVAVHLALVIEAGEKGLDQHGLPFLPGQVPHGLHPRLGQGRAFVRHRRQQGRPAGPGILPDFRQQLLPRPRADLGSLHLIEGIQQRPHGLFALHPALPGQQPLRCPVQGRPRLGAFRLQRRSDKPGPVRAGLLPQGVDGFKGAFRSEAGSRRILQRLNPAQDHKNPQRKKRQQGDGRAGCAAIDLQGLPLSLSHLLSFSPIFYYSMPLRKMSI